MIARRAGNSAVIKVRTPSPSLPLLFPFRASPTSPVPWGSLLSLLSPLWFIPPAPGLSRIIPLNPYLLIPQGSPSTLSDHCGLPLLSLVPWGPPFFPHPQPAHWPVGAPLHVPQWLFPCCCFTAYLCYLYGTGREEETCLTCCCHHSLGWFQPPRAATGQWGAPAEPQRGVWEQPPIWSWLVGLEGFQSSSQVVAGRLMDPVSDRAEGYPGPYTALEIQWVGQERSRLVAPRHASAHQPSRGRAVQCMLQKLLTLKKQLFTVCASFNKA